MNTYYVYAYLRASDLTPYYIGKGKGRRAFADHCHVNLPSCHSRIVFLESNLSEIGALALERRMIRWYGRKDNGTGILLNMTDGGDGTSGYSHTTEARQKIKEFQIGKTRSTSTRKKIAQSKVGRIVTTDTRNKLRDLRLGKPGHQHTEQSKKLMSDIKLGHEVSKETRDKISEKNKGKLAWNKDLVGSQSHDELTRAKMSDSRRRAYARDGCVVKGRIWITDGEICRMINPTDLIPVGWRRGRTYPRGKQ
jgi:hypothetical protein